METERKRRTKRIIHDWILTLEKRTGLKPTPLARFCGLDPQTLLNAKDLEHTYLLSLDSIDKICEKTGAPPPVLGTGEDAKWSGFAEPELTLIEPPESGSLDQLAQDECDWEIKGGHLAAAGFLPGDRVTASTTAERTPGSIVVAQIIDHQTGSAETVIRRFDPPFLVTRAVDDRFTRPPLLVDNDRVSIWGKVVRMIRTMDVDDNGQADTGTAVNG